MKRSGDPAVTDMATFATEQALRLYILEGLAEWQSELGTSTVTIVRRFEQYRYNAIFFKLCCIDSALRKTRWALTGYPVTDMLRRRKGGNATTIYVGRRHRLAARTQLYLSEAWLTRASPIKISALWFATRKPAGPGGVLLIKGHGLRLYRRRYTPSPTQLVLGYVTTAMQY